MNPKSPYIMRMFDFPHSLRTQVLLHFAHKGNHVDTLEVMKLHICKNWLKCNLENAGKCWKLI